MTIAVRIVGAALILLGAANLAALLVIEPTVLVSPLMFTVRHVLMIVAGLGFLLIYKWAIFVYLGSFVLNWLAYFFIYEQQSLGPAWLSVPIPLVVTVLTLLAWGRLKPASGGTGAEGPQRREPPPP